MVKFPSLRSWFRQGDRPRFGRFALAAAILFSSATASAQVIVNSPAGSIMGKTEGDVSVFRGIPYAEAPVGELRWKPPLAKARWEGVMDADRFGAICYQPEFPNVPANIYYENLPAMSEDCLSLNIWRPKSAVKAPVFVWIHGGSLLTGASLFSMYDGTRLAQRGVIVVSINYRLGALGFMAHPELSAESEAGVSGNYGLLDQIEALRWIERNIEAFGGDPDNVTIAGESAGALSIMNLLGSPPAQGLFDKAILQSGYMISQPHLKEERHGHAPAEAEGLRLADALDADSIDKMRAINPEAITKRALHVGFHSHINVDGHVIPHQMVDIFDNGLQSRVPILAGFNTGETRSLRMLVPKTPSSKTEYERAVRERYGDLADLFLRIYPADDIEDSMLQAVRDALYGWTTQRLAVSHAALDVPAYLYLFDHGYRAADRAGLHAFHGAEIPYMFGTIWQTGSNWPRIPQTKDERALSDTMIDYWTSFAASGRPEANGKSVWPGHSADGAWMVFADTPQIVNDVLGLRYDLNEAVVCRRRAAGDQQWNWNVGIASPPLPVRVEQCR